MNSNDIEQLAELTRGMLIADIEQAVINFVNNGDLPTKPLHPTNTCDPYTGNWFEHLMDPFKLRNILIKNGYDSTVIPGYYGESKNISYNIIKYILNSIISKHKWLGLKLAPFYAIWGLKKYN